MIIDDIYVLFIDVPTFNFLDKHLCKKALIHCRYNCSYLKSSYHVWFLKNSYHIGDQIPSDICIH